MRCANVADTGSLKVLSGLIKLDNPLTLLQAVYPTEKNTAVYGPLRGLDTDTWNKWVGAVGSYGSYGNKLQALGEVNDQNQLNEIISQYAYGYAVTAGRSILASKATQGGSAGGYVGRMEGGTVTKIFSWQRLIDAVVDLLVRCLQVLWQTQVTFHWQALRL